MSLSFNTVFFWLQKELAKHIDDYTNTYEPDDEVEWNVVLNEIRSFIDVSEFK
jgi:hypothetical protein